MTRAFGAAIRGTPGLFPIMNRWKSSGKFDQIAERLSLLVDQRRKAFARLYESGQWKHYYTEDALLRRMREVAATSEAWDEVRRTGGPGAVPDSAKIEAVRRRRMQA